MDSSDVQIICDSLERILRDAPLDRADGQRSANPAFTDLWDTLDQNGYPYLAVGEEHGGLAAPFADCLPLIAVCGKYALPAPLADSILANAILSLAGIAPPRKRVGLVAKSASGDYLSHATQVDAALCYKDGAIVFVTVDQAKIQPAHKSEDGAGTVQLNPNDIIASAPAPASICEETLYALGGLARAAASTGAMQAVLGLTLQYTNEREQFGRPLAKFQAIQHLLSDIAGETAASIAAVELARKGLRTWPEISQQSLADIAIAKVRSSLAATIVAANAHQAHGALGFTNEYALGRFTRRLWQWQDEFGCQTDWAERLGRFVSTSPTSTLWQIVSA